MSTRNIPETPELGHLVIMDKIVGPNGLHYRGGSTVLYCMFAANLMICLPAYLHHLIEVGHITWVGSRN